MQITKAMELVASSKMRRAKERAERTQPFLDILHGTLWRIAQNNRECRSVFLQERPVQKRCIVLIAGDRGLAGGYNQNVFRLLEQAAEDTPCSRTAHRQKGGGILPAPRSGDAIRGVCGCGGHQRVGLPCHRAAVGRGIPYGTGGPRVADYTNFASILVQTPCTLQLLQRRTRASSTKRPVLDSD